jgi:hypothetical protein
MMSLVANGRFPVKRKLSSQAKRDPHSFLKIRTCSPVRNGTDGNAANDLIRKLTSVNGPLMFHQSRGCCDGSAPMCYTAGEFRAGGAGVLLGELVLDQIEEPIIRTG